MQSYVKKSLIFFCLVIMSSNIFVSDRFDDDAASSETESSGNQAEVFLQMSLTEFVSHLTGGGAAQAGDFIATREQMSNLESLQQVARDRVLVKKNTDKRIDELINYVSDRFKGEYEENEKGLFSEDLLKFILQTWIDSKADESFANRLYQEFQNIYEFLELKHAKNFEQKKQMRDDLLRKGLIVKGVNKDNEKAVYCNFKTPIRDTLLRTYEIFCDFKIDVDFYANIDNCINFNFESIPPFYVGMNAYVDYLRWLLLYKPKILNFEAFFNERSDSELKNHCRFILQKNRELLPPAFAKGVVNARKSAQLELEEEIQEKIQKERESAEQRRKEQQELARQRDIAFHKERRKLEKLRRLIDTSPPDRNQMCINLERVFLNRQHAHKVAVARAARINLPEVSEPGGAARVSSDQEIVATSEATDFNEEQGVDELAQQEQQNHKEMNRQARIERRAARRLQAVEEQRQREQAVRDRQAAFAANQKYARQRYEREQKKQRVVEEQLLQPAATQERSESKGTKRVDFNSWGKKAEVQHVVMQQAYVANENDDECYEQSQVAYTQVIPSALGQQELQNDTIILNDCANVEQEQSMYSDASEPLSVSFSSAQGQCIRKNMWKAFIGNFQKVCGQNKEIEKQCDYQGQKREEISIKTSLIKGRTHDPYAHARTSGLLPPLGSSKI